MKILALLLIFAFTLHGLHSQTDENEIISIEIKYCDNTIDTVYHTKEIVDKGNIPSFKKTNNGLIDFLDFFVIDCEQFPIIPKYDENDKIIDENSSEYVDYLAKTSRSVSLEYLSNDTIIVNVRESHNCSRSFVGQISFIPEESLILLNVTPFGNYSDCYCIYLFVFKFVFSEAKKSKVDFKICNN